MMIWLKLTIKTTRFPAFCFLNRSIGTSGSWLRTAPGDRPLPPPHKHMGCFLKWGLPKSHKSWWNTVKPTVKAANHQRSWDRTGLFPWCVRILSLLSIRKPYITSYPTSQPSAEIPTAGFRHTMGRKILAMTFKSWSFRKSLPARDLFQSGKLAKRCQIHHWWEQFSPISTQEKKSIATNEDSFIYGSSIFKKEKLCIYNFFGYPKCSDCWISIPII